MKLAVILLFVIGSFVPPTASGDPVIVVNKATHELGLFQNGREVFHAPVATGKTKELTPEGVFTIKVKAVNPYYRKKNIPGGDPRNPLGSRWIGFDANGTDGRIFGVHGTNKPASIGKSVSAGCIRMKNQNVEKLYDLVKAGDKIIVTNQNKSLAQIYHDWEKNTLQSMMQ
ncbi:L,D-transpeptidase [Halobacillus salinarum]|uniref:L,D-transpeptidase n=1 Tax=Halobacillus salinarum TaxID=2932257 RepID=A0ABY4EG73_9BACI|nr:L,D-transpeptidase [Halobacillus salinarum]UOQ42614.1 L,D-transpeptidase [Halobacillus salinarum]